MVTSKDGYLVHFQQVVRASLRKDELDEYQRMGCSEMASVDRNRFDLDMPEIDILCTSWTYHLDPLRIPTAIRSLVATCCTAKGLIEATALLIESTYYFIFTSIRGKATLLKVQIWIKSFMNFNWWINFESCWSWGSFLGWHLKICFWLIYL